MSSGDRATQPPVRRQSIANRLLGSFSQARKDKGQDKDIGRDRRRDGDRDVRDKDNNAPSNVHRRTSSSNSKTASPVMRIREWLDACNGDHDHHCNGGGDNAITTWRPAYLIDSAERCLVRTKPTDRYLALSYVWGPTASRRDDPDGPLQLLRSNVEALQIELPDKNIPQTILDAIWLSRKLGLRYLWVDRLCIVQDDLEDKENHIRNMAYVFSNAYLTIISAFGDVHTGLVPLNPKRPPTRGARSGNRDHKDLLSTSRWNTRGWTLQERFYSRRAVFFFEDAITWECHCNLWQGSTTSLMKKFRGNQHDCSNPIANAAFGYQHSPWPDLDEYARIAADYSARRVTLVDDTLKAFSGITHMLSRVFTGGFMYGMPLMFLDIALLWRPQASIRRRALTRQPFLPSWSWMGWWFDGVPVDLTLWRAAADYVEEPKSVKQGQGSKRFQPLHPFRIKPTVTWTLTDRTSTVPVANIGMQHRELRSRSRRNADMPLPPGWSRTGSNFQHDSDETALFKYPVPVQEQPREGEYGPATGELAFPGPLLEFRTMVGIFDVDFSDTMAPKDKQNPHIAIGNIWSKSEKWIGEFRAHDGWLGIQSSNFDGDEKLEFIAISTAMERRGSYIFTAERFEENMDEDQIVDFVNVLWIERIGGVAYRRGIGHILQKAWEAQATDEKDILLG